MTDEIGEAAAEEVRIAGFLGLVTEMFERSDYLLPLAAGQRQFRQDNYNMASAALLEDLFFDALGMFVRENHPQVGLERRTGKELWDYGVDGLRLSHKETISGGLSVWWTAGDRDPGTKEYRPKSELETFSADHPVVMVYSGCASIAWASNSESLANADLVGGASARTGKLLGSLGSRAIKGDSDKSAGNTLVLGRQTELGRLIVERVWQASEWAPMTFADFWPILGGPGIGERDLWVDRAYAGGSVGLGPVAASAEGAELTLDGDFLMPGVYVMSTSELTDVPMVANNRAHSVESGHARRSMQSARAAGRYVPFPTWFAHFATSQPPNLYAKQREQYEALFAARRRDT